MRRYGCGYWWDYFGKIWQVELFQAAKVCFDFSSQFGCSLVMERLEAVRMRAKGFLGGQKFVGLLKSWSEGRKEVLEFLVFGLEHNTFLPELRYLSFIPLNHVQQNLMVLMLIRRQFLQKSEKGLEARG
jgi:hypothetical protein